MIRCNGRKRISRPGRCTDSTRTTWKRRCALSARAQSATSSAAHRSAYAARSRETSASLALDGRALAEHEVDGLARLGQVGERHVGADEEIEESVGVGLFGLSPHDRAVPLPHLDQAARSERADGVAYDAAADAERLDQLRLRGEAMPCRPRPGQHAFGEDACDLVGER